MTPFSSVAMLAQLTLSKIAPASALARRSASASRLPVWSEVLASRGPVTKLQCSLTQLTAGSRARMQFCDPEEIPGNLGLVPTGGGALWRTCAVARQYRLALVDSEPNRQRLGKAAQDERIGSLAAGRSRARSIDHARP